MAMFFFVVGLEIKRELVDGELRDPRDRGACRPSPRSAAWSCRPLIYVAFNRRRRRRARLGHPDGHRHRLRLGVLALLGSRVPRRLRLFLLALAIVDDIGAILVIAVFYTDDLSLALARGRRRLARR